MATLKVILISENKNVAYKMRKILNEYSFSKGIFYEMTVCTKLKLLLKKDMAGAILFIDERVDGKSCLCIVDILHQNDNFEKMILMTKNFDTAMSGYKVGAYDVLTAPISSVEVFKVLDHALKPKYENDIIEIRAQDGIHHIKSSEIILIKGNGKLTNVVLKDETIESVSQFNEILCKLPKEYFFPCHKSYIINFRKLRRISGNNSLAVAVMVNGQEIPISRRRREEFNNARENFLENNFNL